MQGGVPLHPSPYLGVDPLGAGGSVLHPAVEVHGQHVLGTGFLPGVAVPEPVVGFFHLPEGARAVTGSPSPGDHPGLCHVEGGWERLRLLVAKGMMLRNPSALNPDFGTAG